MIKQTTLLLALLAMLAGNAFAQQPDTKALLEKALREKSYKHADSLLRAKLNSLFQQQAYDSLPAYVMYVGRVEEQLSSPAAAEKKIKMLIDKAAADPNATRAIPGMYGELAEYYASIDKLDQAYNSSQQAYRLEEKSPSPRLSFMAALDSDMGTFTFRNGEMNLSQYHRRKAIAYYLDHPDTNPESFYSAANNMASGMWMASKLDSSLYYFDLALEALARTDSTPINRYYRPAVLQNNMCAIYGVQGKTQKAIETMRACIENLRIYLSIPESIPKKTGAEGFQYMAIDNLGGIYKDLGDYSQALSLEWYSYEQKQKQIDKEPAAVYQSQILLGQLYLAMKDHGNALLYLQTGLDNITKLDGDYLFWQADACASLALLHEEQHDNKKASLYYQKADSLYESSLQGEYDDIYLEFLRNAASFYVDNGQLDVALSKANKGANYVKRTQGAQTLTYFYQLTNLAELYLKAGNFRQSLDYSKQGLQIVQAEIRNSTSLLDSVKIELKKPEAVLLKVKAEYSLLKDKNRENLSQLLQELNSAVSIIERRKSVIREAKDISVIMAGHTELLQFIKKITLDLYELTADQAYINQLIDLQESGTYYRIRSRLDKSDSVRFAHVPLAVQQKEKELKAALQASLTNGSDSAGVMQRYFLAVKEWDSFVALLKKDYPEYYKMRYGSIVKSVPDVQKSLPENSTLVRYMFVDKQLYALVADRSQRHWVALKPSGLENSIRLVADYGADTKKVTAVLHELYQQLWQPLAQHIHTKKIILIPDGILFNLNFEILTPKKINGYEELVTSSLLSSYTFSYHYTLTLVGQQNKTSAMPGNFVAFAPGFLEEGKKQYAATVKDSFQLDRSYITLLPQPFTLDFVEKAQSMFGGKAYVNNASTASSFKAHAGQNKIIHIGTHAESNNLQPEFSRLIFSKNDAGEANSLFLHELYNCDLRSELAVLTACESGKPGYQDGEGMISLAHAFNYAGSESMVTGLWMIDEKASTLLMESFYDHLLKGMDKDEALREAKLSYLASAKGRMLAPPYWAGLVLMGDTSPVAVAKRSTAWMWWIGGVVLVLGGIAVMRRRLTR